MASPCWRASATPWCWPGNSPPSSAAPTSPATSWTTARWSTAWRGSGTRRTYGRSARGPTGWVERPALPDGRGGAFIHTTLLMIGPPRLTTSRRTGSTSSRWGQPTWRGSACRPCPATPSCARSGPSPCQVHRAFSLVRVRSRVGVLTSFERQVLPTICKYERCGATPWCCYGNHQCTRAATRSTGSTWTLRRRGLQRRRGGESTTRRRRRRSSRSLEVPQDPSSAGSGFEFSLSFRRLRIWRRRRRTCSACAPRTKPVLVKRPRPRSRYQLWPKQV